MKRMFPLWAQHKIENSPTKEFIRSDIKNITLVDITSAAKWFYEDNEQEIYDWREDFPCITPPWKNCWFEFSLPRFHRLGKNIREVHNNYFDRFGVHILSMEIEAEERRDALAMDILRRVTVDRMQHAGEFLPNGITERKTNIQKAADIGLAPRWMAMFSLSGMKGKKIIQLVTRGTYIDEMGKPFPGECCVLMTSPFVYTQMKNQKLTMEQMEESVFGLAASIMPVYLSLSLLHCKNVKLIDEPDPPKAVLKKQIKKGKPALRFKTLVIEPLRQQIRRESEPGEKETSIQRALHICRGHFKDYREGKGLFGKYKDIYWWEMQARGSRQFGEIVKDYEISMEQ